jgi:hypothetical protein
MRRLIVPLALALALASLTAAVALGATPPVADTAPAIDVGQTQATLTAKVDPKGSATAVHFEVGTSTSYGLQSATKDAGSGSGTVTVEIPVQGLSANTTYHYRVLATSDGGSVQGADATFKTAAVPPAVTAPSVSTTGAREGTPSGMTILGRINPRGAATSWHVDYGATTAYGSSTPAADLGAGTGMLSVRQRIEGLAPGKRYHYRIVATNAKGTTSGGDHTFTTTTTPTSATLAADGNPVTYGRPVVLTGKLGGSKTSGVRVRLQTTSFPFSSPFADALSPATSSKSGTYSFTLPAVWMTTRALVIAEGAPSLLSPTVVIRSAVRTGIRTITRTTLGSATVSGRVTPYTANGFASLQRQSATGRWLPLRRATPGPDGRYSVTVGATRAPMTLRVVGVPRDGGGHVTGVSRTVRVAGRRR